MCTTAVAYECIRGTKLLLLSNRDEFLERPTRAAQVWPSNTDVVGGQDLREGGSWLACSCRGRFANVTNYREPDRSLSGAPSRGHLVTSFLTSDLAGPDFARSIDGTMYNGFNMLIWDGNVLAYVSNRADAVRVLEPGIHGMSNGAWDSEWPKVARARQLLSDRVARGALSNDELLPILLDRTQAATADLPSTGVSKAWERTLSSVFIRTPTYGTRCSTIVRVLSDGPTMLDEYSHEPERTCASHVHLQIPVPA